MPKSRYDDLRAFDPALADFLDTAQPTHKLDLLLIEQRAMARSLQSFGEALGVFPRTAPATEPTDTPFESAAAPFIEPAQDAREDVPAEPQIVGSICGAPVDTVQ